MYFFRETTFRPLGGAAPSNFLHELEIDQGLLAHTPKGDEGPPQKKFNRENLKLGLKFNVLGSITSGLVGVSSWNFFSRRAARQEW